MRKQERRKHWLDDVEVELIPASELPPNPLNPYDRLPPVERRARFIALLAGNRKG